MLPTSNMQNLTGILSSVNLQYNINDKHSQWLKWEGQGAQLPAVNEKKCYFMYKMCQIPDPHWRLYPMSPLLDLATSTIVHPYNHNLKSRRQRTANVYLEMHDKVWKTSQTRLNRLKIEIYGKSRISRKDEFFADENITAVKSWIIIIGWSLNTSLEGLLVIKYTSILILHIRPTSFWNIRHNGKQKGFKAVAIGWLTLVCDFSPTKVLVVKFAEIIPCNCRRKLHVLQ